MTHSKKTSRPKPKWYQDPKNKPTLITVSGGIVVALIYVVGGFLNTSHEHNLDEKDTAREATAQALTTLQALPASPSPIVSILQDSTPDPAPTFKPTPTLECGAPVKVELDLEKYHGEPNNFAGDTAFVNLTEDQLGSSINLTGSVIIPENTSGCTCSSWEFPSSSDGLPDDLNYSVECRFSAAVSLLKGQPIKFKYGGKDYQIIIRIQ